MPDSAQQPTPERRSRDAWHQLYREAEADAKRLREIEAAQARALAAAGAEIRKLRAALGLSPVIREPANV